jgi:predicted DNA-binding protein
MSNDQLVALRMPKELLDQVDLLALEEGRSRSGMLRRIINIYINSVPYVKQ